MSNLAQINDTQVSIINFNSIPVVTTEMLADFYKTDAKHIQNNYLRNSARFVEGKHFFKLVGDQLKKFKNLPSLRGLVNKRAPHLTLWTERGAARHAKMLDTDQAWEVFEQLEDCYFIRKEILAKTHKSEREPLTNAVNLLVAKTKHLNYSDAYKLVHQRFNVQHIDEIPYDSIPVAVEYVHHLIALYGKADQQGSLFDKENYELIRELTEAVLSQNFMMQDVWKALMLINQNDMMYYSKYVLKANELAREVSIKLDFKTKQKVPLVSEDLRSINFFGGLKMDTNPKWFNAPAW
ncbi:MAG TPA: ORF6N domain-containing protein [Acinetobacter venetianus]|jgi:hypothetical protein|uniref:ORF6N domain-containing protein n=1 Tax=Acinetobacter venetianus TaxID=52133 RepID=UPI001A12E39E|nr:ORF6N domain-containing protein [Acinetobacter venetianus]HIQ36213.1 ORF6N domain-containing protein [Acinetobacter venetianus]